MTMTSAASVATSEEPVPLTDYLVIDVDQHFFEPLDMWKKYLPSKFHDDAPRYAIDSYGIRREIISNRTAPRLPAVPVPRKHSVLKGSWDLDKKAGVDQKRVLAGSDPKTRLELMDAENISAVIIYPTVANHFGVVQDVEVLTALCRAYNDWAAEYCSAAPDRLRAAAVVPQRDVKATLIEARRAITDLGMTGIVLRPNPVGRSVEDPAWEPLWDMLNELEAPVAFHEGTSLIYDFLGRDRTDNFIFHHVMAHPFEQMAAMLMMIGGGILDRHPKLKVFFVEAGCGWVPYWLERMEHHFAAPYESMQLSLTPTELFHRQCYVAADCEEGAVIPGVVHAIGSDNVCWTTDFPHPDHEWTGQAKRFLSRTDIDDDAKRKLIGANAAAAYNIRDPHH